MKNKFYFKDITNIRNKTKNYVVIINEGIEKGDERGEIHWQSAGRKYVWNFKGYRFDEKSIEEIHNQLIKLRKSQIILRGLT